MPTTQRLLQYPVLTDAPNVPADIQALAEDVEAAIDGALAVGVPAGATVSLTGAAWTPICSVAITLPYDTLVEIVGWARVQSTGAGRPMVALRVLDGSTFLFGTGQRHVGGTGDAFGEEDIISTPRRKIALAAGAHTLNLEGYKDANGAIDVKKTQTLAGQAIDTTGLEVSYP